MSTICMKLDLDMHIGLHLVFFGKTSMTTDLVVMFHGLVVGRWCINHPLIAARIRHSYHEALQICT
jgi:hypothetical protein